MTTRWMAVALGAAVLIGPPAYAQQANDPAQKAEPTELNVEAVQESRGDSDAGFVAKMRRIADEWQLAERLNGEIDGWYPRLGGMTRGSGFALGPGYRLHPFGSPVLVDVSAGLSIKGYQAADAKVRWFQAYGDRVEFWTDARYEHFPQEDFYGMGIDSLLENQTSYEFDSTGISLRGLARPVPWLELGTTFGYLRPRIESGTDPGVPSIEGLFTDIDAPGLARTPRYLHTTLYAEVDRRDVPGNPASGGVYRTSVGVWDDQNLDNYDHRRFDALAVQHVPLNAGRTHILSGRLGTAYVNNETGHRVPFYFLAYVGGVDTIRSFDEFRFKDENALWLGAEYRWVFHKYASVATFVDAGTVKHDWQDLTFTGLKSGYGFGLRAHTRTQTLARIDFGFGGGEGFRAFLKLGPSF
jgi:outer membrane protein assembly factor BamA